MAAERLHVAVIVGSVRAGRVAQKMLAQLAWWARALRSARAEGLYDA